MFGICKASSSCCSAMQVQQIQSGDNIGGPSSTDQQDQQAADLQNTAQQPVQVAPSVAPAKPLEPPEPDQYTVSISSSPACLVSG